MTENWRCAHGKAADDECRQCDERDYNSLKAENDRLKNRVQELEWAINGCNGELGCKAYQVAAKPSVEDYGYLPQREEHG